MDHVEEDHPAVAHRISSSSSNNEIGAGSNSTATAINTDARSSIPEDKLVESIYKQLMESLCQDVAVNMHELIKTGADDVVPSSWKLFSGTTVPSRRDLYPELYNGKNENDSEEKKDDKNEPSKADNDKKEDDKPLPKNEKMTDSEIQDLLEKYAVTLPTQKNASSPGNKRRKRDSAEEEEKRRLLSKIQKEKESNYKDSDDEDENTNDDDDDDDEDEDDEDFKMEDDDEEDDAGSKKRKRGRSMSTSSAPPEANVVTELTAAEKNYSTKLDIWGKMPAKEPKNRLCRCQICGRLISTSRFASHLAKCMGLSTSRGGGNTSNGTLLKATSTTGGMKKRSITTR